MHLTDRKLMSAVFIFDIKGAEKDKIFNFLKGSFSVMWPYRYDFWCIFRDLCEASNKYNFAVFFKI